MKLNNIPDLPNEKWINLEEFPNYELSNYGRLVNLKTGKLKTANDDGAGYKFYTLYVHNKRFVKRRGRLVFETFKKCKCEETIDHKNRDKADDKLSNLRCVSNKENCNNKEKGKIENKYNLTLEDKAKIAQALRDGTKSTWVIMKEYGLPMKYSRMVRQRGSWLKYIEQ